MSKFTVVIVLSYLFSDYLFASTKQSRSIESAGGSHTHGVDSDSSGYIENIVRRAHELIGTPYQWGGTSESKGFDCSGLLFYLFRSEVGINIPRTTSSMLNSTATTIFRDDLKSGDAIFFQHNGGSRMRHVGIYIGGDRFIHSPRKGKSVRIDSLSNSYWNKSYFSAKRFY
ncbi:C40 family peptidase [Pseudomonas sp. TAE6080]|nr:C40 family peptidase [Pseudomonas sp. TAE6080]